MSENDTKIILGPTGRWRHRSASVFLGHRFFERKSDVVILEIEVRDWRAFYPNPPPARGAKPTSLADTRCFWRRATLSDAGDLDASQQVKS